MNSRFVFNLEDALARVDDDREIFRVMAEIFLAQGPKDLAEIQAALAAKDAAALARCAHRLKGAILQFSAPAALDATRKLEELGQAGDVDRAASACARLETEVLLLLTALRQQLHQDPSL